MEFTNQELYLLSRGLLAMLYEAYEAKKINIPSVQNAIDNYIVELKTLNGKVCGYMEDEE